MSTLPDSFALSPAEKKAYADGSWLGVGNRRPHVISPTGVVHQLSDRIRLGFRTTRCGQYIERGWGKQRVNLELDCRRCIHLLDGDRRRARADRSAA